MIPFETPSTLQQYLTLEARQLEHYADQVIEWRNTNPEESEEAVEIARRVGERLVKELSNGKTS